MQHEDHAKTQPDRGNMHSQIESDVDMSLMTTPQGMSLHTPHMITGTRN